MTLEEFIKKDCNKLKAVTDDKKTARWVRRKANIKWGYALWLIRRFKREEEKDVRR